MELLPSSWKLHILWSGCKVIIKNYGNNSFHLNGTFSKFPHTLSHSHKDLCSRVKPIHTHWETIINNKSREAENRIGKRKSKYLKPKEFDTWHAILTTFWSSEYFKNKNRYTAQNNSYKLNHTKLNRTDYFNVFTFNTMKSWRSKC